MAELLVVRSKVKSMAKGKPFGVRVSEEFIQGLSKNVKTSVEIAANKAKQEGRKTLQIRDLA